MPTADLIEVLLDKELAAICMHCARFESCTYRKSSTRIIIQCELYERATERRVASPERNPAKGLCVSCSHAETCELPDKEFGAWRCDTYQ